MALAYYKSPIGILELRTSRKGLHALKKVDSMGTGEVLGNEPIIKRVKQQLDCYFKGELTQFDIPIDYKEAGAFNISVWEALQRIPYGKTTSYEQIAIEIGSPKAFQAVGLANKNNPIAIVIPCHRVIGKNGDLTGFFYGLDVKMDLLRLENPRKYGIQDSLFE